LSEGGHQSKPGRASETPRQHEADQPRLVPGAPQRDPAWALKDPMRLVRAERQAAVAQINRSLKAWRKKGEAAAGKVEIPQSGGAPLSADVRTKMEGRLGADLSAVKVHTSGEAAGAAKGLGARAFTVGEDVHFGAGEYRPGSKEGDRLLAHELTHVVQGQRSGVQRKPAEPHPGEQGQGAQPERGEQNAEHSGAAHEVSQPGEPAEQEADAVADQVADGLHGTNQGQGEQQRHGPEAARGAQAGRQGSREEGEKQPGVQATARAAGTAGTAAAPKQISAKLETSIGRKAQLERMPSHSPPALNANIVYRTPTGRPPATALRDAARAGIDRPSHNARPVASAVVPAPATKSTMGPRVYRSANGPASDASLHEKAGPGNLKQANVSARDGKADVGLVNVGDRSMAANPKFEQAATAFEDNLGAKAWAHPVAQAASSDMAKKAKAYLQDRVGGKWDAANDQLAGLCKEIGSDNAGWSGAAGKAVKDVMAVFDEGNLAERMNHIGEFFIRVMGKDLVETDAKELEKRLADAKMNVAGLMKRRSEMLEKQKARGGKPNNWDIAPTSPDSAAAGQWHARADRADVAGVPREDKKGRAKVAQSDRNIAETGAALSTREEALHQKEQLDWSKDKHAVKWEEGVKVWIINERDKWVQVQRSLSLPLGAGPSGTTNMLMQAAQALKAEPLSARLACIGYLLPAHHHTLVEVLAAAAAFGCDYTPGQRMYRNIKPLSESELRACGNDNKFPDETSGDETAPTDRSAESPKSKS
jgi:hypothetical protein